MDKFLSFINGHLGLIPTAVAAFTALQQIGHTKESALAKVTQIIEVSAALGEQIPEKHVQAVSTTIEDIAQRIFGTPAAPQTPAVG